MCMSTRSRGSHQVIQAVVTTLPPARRCSSTHTPTRCRQIPPPPISLGNQHHVLFARIHLSRMWWQESTPEIYAELPQQHLSSCRPCLDLRRDGDRRARQHRQARWLALLVILLLFFRKIATTAIEILQTIRASYQHLRELKLRELVATSPLRNHAVGCVPALHTGRRSTQKERGKATRRRTRRGKTVSCQ